MPDDTPSPVLELKGIHKQFGGIPVLRDVRLNLYPGEIHALMGQNGAGKSTLIKVLTGVLPSSGGEMLLEGRPIRPHSPLEAQKLGIRPDLPVFLDGQHRILPRCRPARQPCREGA